MQSRNVPFGLRENPLVKSLYVQQSEIFEPPTPPIESFWVTEEGVQFVTEEGEKFVFIVS